MAHDPRKVSAVVQAVVATAILAAGLGPCVSARSDDLADLLDRGTRYVTGFVSGFSTVVAREEYVQQRGPISGVARTRRLTSDFLLVRPDAMSDWLVFRDVLAVDGHTVNGGSRLVQLLTLPAASLIERGRAITAESARFALPDWPTINSPLLVISFLQEQYRSRFRFVRDKGAFGEHDNIVAIRFEERTRPTIIRAGTDDVVAQGRIWLDRLTGRVSMTQLAIATPNAVVLTEFDRDAQLQRDVPVRMTETYITGNSESRGSATYSQFRVFQVGTKEQIERPSR